MRRAAPWGGPSIVDPRLRVSTGGAIYAARTSDEAGIQVGTTGESGMEQ
jgi:hypothetical protein